MPFEPAAEIGQCRDLLHRFGYVVFAESALPGGDGFAHRIGRMRLADGQQRDALHGPRGRFACACDARPHLLQLVCDHRHNSPSIAVGHDPRRCAAPATTPPRGPMDITQLLAFSVKNKASDLHLSAGLPPMIRVHGDVRRINVDPLDHKQVHGMVYDIMNDSQRKAYEETLECDFSFEIQGPRALSRQCVQPEPRRGRGVQNDSLEDPDARAAQRAESLRRSRVEAARLGAGDRPHGFGQVDHPRGDGQSPERKRVRPRADRRGSDRVRPRIEEVPDQPARGRAAYAELQQRASFGLARRPRRDPSSAKCAISRRSVWR